MQDSINIQARNYTGKGNLQICHSDIADCYINIHFRHDGKYSITCWFYLTNEYAKTLYDILEKEMSTVVYATFKGEDAEGANISIEKMALTVTMSTVGDDDYFNIIHACEFSTYPSLSEARTQKLAANPGAIIIRQNRKTGKEIRRQCNPNWYFIALDHDTYQI